MTNPHLLRCPRVKIDGLDFADVRAHSTVDTRAAYTQKDTTDAHMKRNKNKHEHGRTHMFHEAQRGSKNRGEGTTIKR
jgi:hypothetical protein